mmetsp:Transcript_27654/g.60233  ORF Transcript_27654/g.60233 Transcript_27654/m.60233 type:complete len:349 (-) Transcript_27654:938-1984(-)
MGRCAGCTMFSVSRALNGQDCNNRCTAQAGCQFAYYEYNEDCHIGQDAFYGNQPATENRYDEDVRQLCFHAQGAPGNIASGYKCFDHVDINGYEVWRYLNVASRDECARKCEGKADLCTLAIYRPASGLCVLKNNAFGWGGSGSQAIGQSACLRSASGGNLNSPVDYLCYSYQSVAGTPLTTLGGIDNSTECANRCTEHPECEFAVYNASDSARCFLKKQPFWGLQDPHEYNREDNSAGVCFKAPGAPLVLSGFGERPGFGSTGPADDDDSSEGEEPTVESTDSMGDPDTAGDDGGDPSPTTEGDAAGSGDTGGDDPEPSGDGADDDSYEYDEIDWSGIGFGSAQPLP